MTGALGWTVMASAVVIVLALVDCPAAVLAGTAFGVMGASLAWARFRQGREHMGPVVRGGLSPWTEQDEAVLKGDLSPEAWERAGQARREGLR